MNREDIEWELKDTKHMDTRRNIYVLSIDNEEPSIAATAVQILWEKTMC